MALKVQRRQIADLDIDEIWLHIAVDSPAAADRVVDQIEAAEDRLALFPSLGRARPDIASDLRSWAIGDYLILYRAQNDRLEIVRVVHGARDLGGLFDEDT